MRVFGLFGVMIAAPLMTHAADLPEMPDGLLPLLERPDHRAALLHAIQAVPIKHCAQASYVTTGEVALLQPLRLSTSGQPVSGMWKESVSASGCDAIHVLNAVTSVKANGALETRPLLPGTTITDPQLQRDSVQYAAAGMGPMPPGCEQGGIVDTSFVGTDGDQPGARPELGGALKPWTETWTLQACAKRAQVTMHFTPDATGTVIQAASAQTP